MTRPERLPSPHTFRVPSRRWLAAASSGVRLGITLAAGLFGAAVGLGLGACGGPDPVSPFYDGGLDGGLGGGGQGGGLDSGPGTDPTLGGPCTKDDQCDDGFDCTLDACDQQLLRCRFSPDDSKCQNDGYCDGVEICDNKQGCILGEPVTCSDGDPCKINTCDEASDQCLTEPRDVDQDGDPDIHCGGGDCDDLNPAVSSLLPEVCGNGVDDDCDMEFDELQCAAPTNDTCLDPLDVLTPGTYAMNSAAAALHYSSSCGVATVIARDVVAAVTVPAGQPVDVQLTARAPLTDLALALMGQCSDPASELHCNNGFAHPVDGRVSKVRARSIGDPSAALVLPAYIYTDGGTDLTLRYELLPATVKPANETCGTADILTPSSPTLASVVDAVDDVAMGCGALTGELLYQFDLATTQDVDIYASSVDGDGLPVLSLRDASCSMPADEITCASADSAHIFRHSVPAGSYYVAVAGTAPTDVLVTLELSAPTPPPADEDCDMAPAISANQRTDVLLNNHQDDVNTGCLTGGVDAAYTLDLQQPSDVLVVGAYSQGDVAAVEIALPPCVDPSDELACATATLSPARAQYRNLAAGSYRVVAESLAGQPMELTPLVRAAVPATFVPFANNCSDALAVPATGGFFIGNTSNAQPDFEAGCDQGGQPTNGASDQILELVLTQTKRVVLDMQGSGYSTMLSVREGNSDCPGNEVLGACAVGYYPERSFLDLELAAGTYYILVDGFASQLGPWFLDIFVVDP